MLAGAHRVWLAVAAARLNDPVRGAVRRSEVAVGDGTAVDGAGGRDDVLARVAALPTGASGAAVAVT
ncbi:hypothetical protein [Micromonospora sp. NPDC023814]|uniref:hypothetical protein n=1 Tax=Micromonospora sp. NPDC023814 TaxID=3154596 RepID=UPI0033F28427